MKVSGPIILILMLASTASAQNYSIDWYVIASGGGHAESANFMVDGTIGQPITGISSSANYVVEAGFWVGTAGGSVCGYYVVGDYNGSNAFNVADIVEGFSYLKTGSPDPFLLCECPPGNNAWAVAMDVNNSCGFNVADIVTGFSRLKTGLPEPVPCELCPPGAPVPPVPPDRDRPTVLPILRAKSNIDLIQSGD